LETDQLTEFVSEQYKNSTKDILAVTSDIAYTNVDVLRIYTGKQGIVANIRGTSAATFIESQNGNDKVFVSSDADETADTADTVDCFVFMLGKNKNKSLLHTVLLSQVVITEIFRNTPW